MWPSVLSDRLPIVALVSSYLTNQLIGRGLLLKQYKYFSPIRDYAVLARVSPGYPPLQGRLPTRYSPVRHSTKSPKGPFSFDLHVLGTPPALILSQDQTLSFDSRPLRFVPSPLTGFYTPKSFITHAALLGQGCPHCPLFPTAASRRSLGRVSVPVWPSVLSDRLPIVALVSSYLTN